MTGGGFGGCTVNLVAPAAVDAFEQTMKEAYKERFNIDPNIFRCIPGPGAAEITKIVLRTFVRSGTIPVSSNRSAPPGLQPSSETQSGSSA